MIAKTDDVAGLDRLTRAVAVRLSRRSLFKGALGGAAALAGLQVLAPIEAHACTSCHYCVSGCTSCQTTYFRCCSNDLSTCQYCAGPCGVGVCPCQNFYLKNFICDGGCGSWCDWAAC
jgi:hypothetical protein